MKKQKDKGLVLVGNELKPVTRAQRIGQWWYGFTEPKILQFADYMLKNEKRKRLYVKMKKPRALPAGIIITTDAACRFVDFIYGHRVDNTTARMAVSECVCQTALKRYGEPVKKDMALLYLADMTTTLKHTGIKEKFEVIPTAEEAKAMLRYFHQCGLMHNVFYCQSSGKWTFVMCNCDGEICVPFRSYMAGRTEEMSAGPEVVQFDATKCKGIEQCGACVRRCILQATTVDAEGKVVVDADKCLGCGLCVSTCQGGARTMVARDDYQHEDVLTTQILLGTNE